MKHLKVADLKLLRLTSKYFKTIADEVFFTKSKFLLQNDYFIENFRLLKEINPKNVLIRELTIPYLPRNEQEEIFELMRESRIENITTQFCEFETFDFAYRFFTSCHHLKRLKLKYNRLGFNYLPLMFALAKKIDAINIKRINCHFQKGTKDQMMLSVPSKLKELSLTFYEKVKPFTHSGDLVKFFKYVHPSLESCSLRLVNMREQEIASMIKINMNNLQKIKIKIRSALPMDFNYSTDFINLITGQKMIYYKKRREIESIDDLMYKNLKSLRFYTHDNEVKRLYVEANLDFSRLEHLEV